MPYYRLVTSDKPFPANFWPEADDRDDIPWQLDDLLSDDQVTVKDEELAEIMDFCRSLPSWDESNPPFIAYPEE